MYKQAFYLYAMKTEYKYVIVGAGLSGLITAYKLLQAGEDNFVVLEARARVGGRVLTEGDVDLGATWLQNYHKNLLSLIEELHLKTFDQFSIGQSVLIYNSMAPAHYFEMDTQQPSSKRIVGGSSTLIEALYHKIKDKLQLDEPVLKVEDNDSKIKIHTKTNCYIADKAVITLPPLLASDLEFISQLPKELLHGMRQTHTWMNNAIKVGIEFKKTFWRKNGFSGTIIGQASPVIELYDHSNKEQSIFILKGFVNESLRDLSKSERKEKILTFLEKYFGAEVNQYISYSEKDWSLEKYTSGDQLKSYYLSANYGNTIFQDLYLNSKVLFSGTETAQKYGGYLEGAVLSGLNAYAKIKNDS